MKHAKSNKRVKAEKEQINFDSRDISSFSNRSRDIVSKSSKSKKILDIISKILFPIGMLLVIALIIYVTLVQFFPITYILIFIVLLGILAAVHIRLLSGKKRRIRRKRIISIALSVATLVVSCFGMSYLGIINGAIGDISMGSGENESKVENISKEPFIIYVTGVDTVNDGEFLDKARSDVNMVIAIHPKTKQVLMVSIPRDYYVTLKGSGAGDGKLDKLTHAGLYGIDCSMQTIEQLLDIDFNYYAKFNFKSVVDIVDALGGVTVNSEFDFDSAHSYTGQRYYFTKGENFLLGDAALTFARERESFASGDRQRGKHQQELIRAVVEKAISPSLFVPSNIEKMLDAVSKNTETNFTSKEIKKLISYQMNSMGTSWNFESMSLDGSGSKGTAYSTGSSSVYIMKPNQETIDAAKAAIINVMNGEALQTEDANSNVSSSN